jgi:fumarate hydratase class I
MTEFTYQPMFPLGKEDTPYRHLSDQYVSTMTVDGKEILKIDPAGLEFLAEAAFKDVSHLYRPNHLASLAKILDDPESSANDRYVALEMLRNAVIAAEGAVSHVPGYRHRHHHGKKGAGGLDGRGRP